jgi:tetratricopeptide (TPR) repeat protein
MVDNISRQELEKVESDWISNPSPVLCARLADLLRRNGRLDESRAIASTGLARWKNNISISVVLGKCYKDSGLLEKAMETFGKVNSAQPQNLVALRNLAEIHFQKEHWNKAIHYLEEYLFEQPGDEEVRDRLEEVKSRKNSSNQISLDVEEDEYEPDDEVFPRTDRMSKVLESQGIGTGATAESEKMESSGYPIEEESIVERTTPASLLGFFSDEEKQNLHLKCYDEEAE